MLENRIPNPYLTVSLNAGCYFLFLMPVLSSSDRERGIELEVGSMAALVIVPILSAFSFTARVTLFG